MVNGWRTSLAGLLVAVLAVTALGASWHAGHDATDLDCAICKLREQPLADLAVAPQGACDEHRDTHTETLTQQLLSTAVATCLVRGPPLS